MSFRRFIVASLKSIHMGILFFTLFGSLLPWNAALLAHMIFIPAMILHWRFNDDQCFLTTLTHKFEYDDPKHVPEEEGMFIKSILSKCFNPLPSDQSLAYALYATLALVWLASLLRITHIL